MTATNRTANGRGWAYAGTALGGLVSIAANVAHSFVAPADAPAGWQPPLGAILLAAFWPVALFVAIEILVRTVWRSGWRYIALRFGGLLPVAGTAAIVSYMHLSGLLGHYGEPAITTAIGPLAVDGLMIMSASALMSTGQQHAETAPEPVHPQTPETPSEQPKPPVPQPRPKASRKRARKTAPKQRTDEELIEQARVLNEAALAESGEPISKRKLRTALRVGQPAADRIHAAINEAAPEAAPASVVTHANGVALATNP